MTMTPEAKARLSTTIRALRERLLADLHDAVESAYGMRAPAAQSGLDAAARAKRERLEAWIDEQARALPPRDREKGKERFRREVEKEAAYTLLNRLVYLRLLEAAKLSKPEVVTGGWESRGYKELREFAPGLCGDATEGYAFLLRVVFDELAEELPGLYGDVGLTALVPVPPQTLRAVLDALDDDVLATCWTDDTTLGWVYQYWNDPEREALDAKLNDGGKVEPHEIASKTQMFTERYMVEWLLQNSLGPMWLAMCRRNGWTPEVERDGVLARLEERRKAWREKRERGEVALDALMPIHDEVEERWKYFVPQPIVDDRNGPTSVRKIKVLDPACGSGHFPVIAFTLLFALYREEARHTGADWTDEQIAAWILEDNLHGVDIDPRAVQIAAAALLLKARTVAPRVRPKRLNLVASALRLPADDPAALDLARQVRAETGIPEQLTLKLLDGLRGADHLGSLLKIDAEIDRLIRDQELSREAPQQSLFGPTRREAVTTEEARASLLERLEAFLARHDRAEDLGLRLRGEQLAAGVRFVRIVREGTYDLIVGNPPYQGTAKMADAKYVATHYPRGKADLYAAFLERGLQLVREGGTSALLTMRNWMFIKQYAALREHLLQSYDLRLLGDFDRGAFDEVPNEVLAVALSVIRRAPPGDAESVALQPTPLDDKSYDRARTGRKRAAVVGGVGRHCFFTKEASSIPDAPLIYWWDRPFLRAFVDTPSLSTNSTIRKGLSTCDDTRFLRCWWEPLVPDLHVPSFGLEHVEASWVPYVTGGDQPWIHPCLDIIRWKHAGLEIATFERSRYGRGASNYFQPAVAFSMIGSSFSARAHRNASVLGDKGASVYGRPVAEVLCLLNSTAGRHVLESLNPTVCFQVNDVARLPLFPIESADEIYATLDRAFTEHEAARETSVEFKRPGPSPWEYAQRWAQTAVDRPAGEPLPPYEPVYDSPDPVRFVTFALGVAMGRFGADGEGLLDAPPIGALPDGILWLSPTGLPDGLDHPACRPLLAAWAEHGATVAPGTSLRDWLRKKAFDVHRKQYENRPIWWPLSSEKKSFVAWVAIHRMGPDTLRRLRADWIEPELTALDGRLRDLATARAGADRRAAADAEDRHAEAQKLRDELADFARKLSECAEKGPPPAGGPAREADARYAPDRDDGVMVNASALWPLLEPQWKDPKSWWKELSKAEGRKDYDWSHLAARYFPRRVDAKCRRDPSLAVAHGCFWRYHPARAYAWELRLQDELRPDFLLDEPDAPACREAFLREHAGEAEDIREKERRRRERARARAGDEDEAGQQGLGFEEEA